MLERLGVCNTRGQTMQTKDVAAVIWGDGPTFPLSPAPVRALT